VSLFPFEGVLAALVTPFDSSLRVDLDAFRRVIDYTVDGGCTGIVIGGHTGEFSALKLDEVALLLRTARHQTAGRVALLQGVYAESTQGAIESGLRARDGNADGILVIPPWLFSWGADVDPDVVVQYYRGVTEAVGLPAVAFCYGPAYGFFPPVVRAIAELRHVVGIKLGGPVRHYEACLRAVADQAAVLCCADSSLYPCLAVGGQGALVGLASLTPRWCVDLYESVVQGDLARARELNDRIFVLTEHLYNGPFLKAPLRLKTGLNALGVIDHAYSRPPILPLSRQERANLLRALQSSGLYDLARERVPSPASRR
jgi:4-hydroxy-tetrahydrodipicolinate synthase